MRSQNNDMVATGYGIGGLSKRAEVNIETIRYYERIGLMPAPPRSEGGQRIYDDEHFKRLAFIRRNRQLGFSLGDIRALLAVVGKNEYGCDAVRDLIVAHLANIRQKIADLRQMERALKNMASQCESGSVPDCPVLETLS
jgi:MerR family mercuric resistance operon transcriptional regulator